MINQISSQSPKLPFFYRNLPAILLVAIIVITGGVFVWYYFGMPVEKIVPAEEEIVPVEEEIIAKLIPTLPKEILVIQKEFIRKNEREIAFLQGGDVWVMGKDLKRKYKIIDTEEAITYFSLSPDGKIIYWLNEKGEIWKKDKQEEKIKPLVTVEEDMEEKIIERWDCPPFSLLRGKVVRFHLSPDGRYIAYETIEDDMGPVGACPPFVSKTWIRIMRSDGTEKNKVEHPVGVPLWKNLIRFVNWIPEKGKILFYLWEPSGSTGGSPFFKVGPSGKDAQIYTRIHEKLTPEDSIVVVGTEPIYSPTGESMAYIREIPGIVRIKNINTGERKIILGPEKRLLFGRACRNLIWSEDGSLLLVRGINKVWIFNKEGEIIFKRKFEELNGMPFYSPFRSSVIISPNNSCIGGVKYLKEIGGSEIIFFENILTKEQKKFSPPEFKNYEIVDIYPQFFCQDNRFYYLIELKSPIETKNEYSIYQLWVIDTNTWKNYKIVDNILQAIKIQ